MTKTREVVLALFILGICIPLRADRAPTQGEFVDFFFIDRWAQGVFGSFYVSPDLYKTLRQETWRPIQIDATKIHQPMNPGGAMIRGLESARALSPAKLDINLQLDRPRAVYNSNAMLTVYVSNKWDKPISLYRRDLLLAITVHHRGISPEGKPERDEIYDCFNNPYHEISTNTRLLRATTYTELFTDKGDIKMARGNPHLFIQKEGESKRASLYDEEKRTLEAGASLAFRYAIGTGWYINEYELQVRYRPKEDIGVDHIMSVPIPFDVVASEDAGQQSPAGDVLKAAPEK